MLSAQTRMSKVNMTRRERRERVQQKHKISVDRLNGVKTTTTTKRQKIKQDSQLSNVWNVFIGKTLNGILLRCWRICTNWKLHNFTVFV